MTWEFIFWNITVCFALATGAAFFWPPEERVLAFQIWLYGSILASIAGWCVFSAWFVASAP